MFLIQNEEKQRYSTGLLTNIKIYLFETRNMNTPHKKFYLLEPIITETTNMEMLKKTYFVPVLEYTC